MATIEENATRAVVIEWIDHILERKRWTGTDLARQAELAPSTVLRLLNDPKHKFVPSLKTLQKIAEASGYPIPRKVTEALGAPRMEPVAEGAMSAGRSATVSREPEHGRPDSVRRPVTVSVRYVSTLPSTLHPVIKQDIAVAAPPQLDGDETAFAFYMPDSTIEPWIKAGALLYATKRRDPIAGDIILVTDHNGRSSVRLVRDMDENGFHLSKADIGEKPSVVSFDDISELAIVATVSTV